MVAAQMYLDEDLTNLVLYSTGSAINGSTSHTKVNFRKILGVGEICTMKSR